MNWIPLFAPMNDIINVISFIGKKRFSNIVLLSDIKNKYKFTFHYKLVLLHLYSIITNLFNYISCILIGI